MRTQSTSAILLLAVCVSSACGHRAQPKMVTSLPLASESNALARSLETIAKTFESWRGITLAKPIIVELLDKSAYEKRQKSRRNPCPWTTAAPVAITLELAPISAPDPDYFLSWVLWSKYVRVEASSDGTRLVVMAPPTNPNPPTEVIRALADLSLKGIATAPSLSSSRDQCWANLSLVEGAGTLLAGAAYETLISHSDVAKGLHSGLDAMRALGRDGYVEKVAPMPTAPLLVKRLVSLYYAQSFEFMMALFDKGGLEFALSAVKHPPASTEQLLHPDKYLAGELPVPVSPPAAPAGWKTIEAGSLGEIGIQAMLAECVKDGIFHHVGEGWGGDAYTVMTGPNQRLAVLWSTTWDSLDAADMFEADFRRRAKCWQSPSRFRADGPSIGNAFVLEHRDRSVVIARAWKHDLDSFSIDSLFSVIGSPLPPAPPFETSNRQ